MKVVKYKGNDYSILESWNEITLGQYVDLNSIAEDKISYSEDPEIAELERFIDIAAIITNIPRNVIEDMEPKIVENIFNDLKWFKEIPDAKYIEYFEYKGVLYVINPKNIDELTIGQQITYKTKFKQIKNRNRMIPYICALVVRPGKEVNNVELNRKEYVIDAWDDKNWEERAQIFKNLSIMYFLRIISFFFNGKKQYEQIIKDYIQEKAHSKQNQEPQ